MASLPSSNPENVLHEWIRTGAIHTVIGGWSYRVQLPRTPWIDIELKGVASTPSKRQIPVDADLIFMDDYLLKDWSGHPFEVGEVKLFEHGDVGGNTEVSITLRVTEKTANEVWKALLLGQRDKASILLTVKVKSLTSTDWEKVSVEERYTNRDRNCLAAVSSFSVSSSWESEAYAYP